MIVATVGHVDHGKTALVKALTGVDTDRLPEEKARGMSIELGFAYRSTSDGAAIGFVDVPGHERLVHTTIAGVAGIHHALIVVAADDGPMPQTREHVAILDLLGVGSASVVITKTDRATAARVAEIEHRMRSLLAATGMSGASVFAVCAPRGEGIEELLAHLEGVARACSRAQPRGHFRLAVDRSFTLKGVGLVVTGTAFAGVVAAGDSVAVCPGGASARVRSLHAHNRPARAARAGERCALNLSGVDERRVAVRRGDWIVAGPLNSPTTRIDVRLRLLGDAQPLCQARRVHVHLGAKETTGRAVPLRGSVSAAGGPVQIVLDEPVGALWGDRIVLRDWSAKRTFAGGIVLDPFPSARGRSRPGRLTALGALEIADAGQALRALLPAQPGGVDLGSFALARNLTDPERDRVFAAATMVRVDLDARALGFETGRWHSAREQILDRVDGWHGANPESWGPHEGQLRRAVTPDEDPVVFAARVRALVEEAALARHATRLHRPGYRPALSPQHLALWQRLEPLLAGGGARPPSVGHLATALAMTPAAVEEFLQQVGQLGFVLPVSRNRFYLPDTLSVLAASACALAEEHADAQFSAAEFRDRTGIGRNVTISVLEFFDRCGLTRRAGEQRRILRRPEQVFGAGAR